MLSTVNKKRVVETTQGYSPARQLTVGGATISVYNAAHVTNTRRNQAELRSST